MLKNHRLRFPPLNQPRIYAELSSKMRVTTEFRWMELSGVSRGTTTTLRPPLIHTSAARWMRFREMPPAIEAMLLRLHCTTIIPSVRKEPLEIEAAMSDSWWEMIRPAGIS